MVKLAYASNEKCIQVIWLYKCITLCNITFVIFLSSETNINISTINNKYLVLTYKTSPST